MERVGLRCEPPTPLTGTKGRRCVITSYGLPAAEGVYRGRENLQTEDYESTRVSRADTQLRSRVSTRTGETALVTAAIFAGRTQRLDIAGVIVAAAIEAIVGDNVGYLIERRFGVLDAAAVRLSRAD
jgi:hypothetical protein